MMKIFQFSVFNFQVIKKICLLVLVLMLGVGAGLHVDAKGVESVVASAKKKKVQPQESANAQQARHMFMQTWQRVFNNQGASLHYKVNIANLYKTEGTIWYKGKKSKYFSKNSNCWNDGVTSYVTREKRRVVEIHDAKEKSKYEEKFSFEPDNYTYGIARQQDGFLITLKAKKGVSGVKEAKVLLDLATHNPKKIRIKVAFLWATINISNFYSGDIDDDVFVFPRGKYAGYKFVDER